jgi:ATP-dependent Clp protease ATP-binding subunit ClpA
LLGDKQLRVRLTEKAVDELIENGFDPKMGARPLQRKINDSIKVPLSKKILFENLNEGTTIIVDYTNDEFNFQTVETSNFQHRIDENGYIILEEPITSY